MHIKISKRPEFNVYVDETFEHFMNLPRMDGHFCYTALMLPIGAEAQLRDFWTALDERLRTAYTAETGFKLEGEFKSTFLTKLSPDIRRDAMRRTAYFLERNRGFVAGYFTSVHALMCWELRTSAGSEDHEKLEPYSLEKLQKKAEELRSEKKKRAGESRLLTGLFHTIASIPASWLGLLGASFRICYDSRDPREDRIILKFVHDFFPRWAQSEPNRIATYLGTQTFTDSSQVPGLTLVDLICKEMRNFFLGCPSILEDGSAYRLITPTSSEGAVVPIEIGGRLFKWGAEKPMSDKTKRSLASAQRISTFAPLIPHLADGKLSCYAHFGEGRIVDFARHVFNDQVD